MEKQKIDDIETLANIAFNEDRYDVSLKLYNEMIAKNSDSDALYMLARHYIDGLGVEQDVEKAISILKKSAKRGCLDASYLLLEYVQTTSQCCKG